MGRDIMDEFPEVKKIFKMVDDICQKPISKLCFEGPMDELTLTVNAQPAITAVNLACLTALRESGINAMISGGHSLGEYAAMTSAGIITNEDSLKLVKKRGELMHRESLANPGVMAAVLGMGIDTLSDIVERAGKSGVLAVANHNTAEQIVITGEEEPLSYAVNLIKETGGKARSLPVSGAWHCSLMENAVSEFRQFMDSIPFSKPETTLLFNVTAESEGNPETIKDMMAQHLTSPVKWYEIILKMLEDEVSIFVEVGPKKVLSGMLNRIIPRGSEAKVYNVEDMKSLNLFLDDR
jgi:[acyl-carrier-protein] S-malonyltransferase